MFLLYKREEFYKKKDVEGSEAAEELERDWLHLNCISLYWKFMVDSIQSFISAITIIIISKDE